MTEAEWLAATDPDPMLEFLWTHGGASDRSLRLFGVACCRRVWHLLGDEKSVRAVEVAEWFAERETVTSRRMDAACRDAWGAYYTAPSAGHSAAARAAVHVTQTVRSRVNRWPFGYGESASFWKLTQLATVATGGQGEPAAQVALLRCIFGNPFRPPPSLSTAFLAWGGGTVPRLAAAIYDDRAFDRLPVLADALEDAGCADAEVLGHCRAGGEHVRGCWAVDLVLGKG
jgi:hypothetical protein